MAGAFSLVMNHDDPALEGSSAGTSLLAEPTEWSANHEEELNALRQLGAEVGDSVVAVVRESFVASVQPIDGVLNVIVTWGSSGGSVHGPLSSDSADVVGRVQIMAAALSTPSQELSWSIDPAPEVFEIVVGDGAMIALLEVG